MADKPHAFLSYTRIDDQFFGGAISLLRQELERAVRVVTGDRSFTIFQDIEGIAFGQHWPSRLEEALAEARFLIPILTPSFFTSKPCRKELEKFLELEGKAGRNDLILPIYFVNAPRLEDAERQRSDYLAQVLSERQRRDWREEALLPTSDPRVRRSILKLAGDIAAVMDRWDRTRASSPSPVAREHEQFRLGVLNEPALIRSSDLLEPSIAFRDVDVPWCPELVVLPSGSFVMGSPADEEDRYDDESPQHRVEIRYHLALGRYPVTFAQYDWFCEKTGRVLPGDRGWGRGRRPVINVSWNDAKAYCAWLSEATGKAYRLPSEAEWEYACRARTTTRYWWGDTIGPEHANYEESGHSKTTEVDTYPANSWGLYDMHGNVWEWVEDVWHTNYRGAPVDGSPWLEEGRGHRVVRGGSWLNDARDVRAAHRDGYGPGRHGDGLGFRCARVQA